MTGEDVEAVSAIRVNGWKTAYAGIVPQPYLDGMTIEADTRQHRRRLARSHRQVLDLVAVHDQAGTVGWGCLGPCRGEAAEQDLGEVLALYVRPDLTGRGIGGALLDVLHRHAVDRGFDTLVLWVLRDNLRARRFYTSAGYTADGATRCDTYGDVAVPELRCRRTRRRCGGTP